MHEETENAKQTILTALENINEIDRKNPNNFLIQIFTNTKASEIANIFSQGDLTQRNQVHRIMVRLDPANSQKYDIIKRG